VAPGWEVGLFGADAAHIAWWQMCARAVIVFVAGLVLIRLVGARTFSRASPVDIVVSVVLGSNLSRAITGSVLLGPTLLASAVIVGLHACLIRLGVYSHWAGVLMKGRPAILVKDGRECPGAVKREGISRGDFEELLREAGLTDIKEVRLATRERSGKVSVLKHAPGDNGERAPHTDSRPRGDLEHAAVADAAAERDVDRPSGGAPA
jgi:uncharacterized membrane protein YcaP (DUF421 family)